MNEHFSQETKDLISESRLIAINLGHDYISTLHFFLADCKLNDRFTIINLFFQKSEDFLNFYNAQKTICAGIYLDNIHLTLECEMTLKRAFKLWKTKNYPDAKIYPYHLFLAASMMKETTFYLIFDNKEDVFQRVERYYFDIGQLKPENKNVGIWASLKKKLFNK
jgi:hypothetical protein